MKSLSKAAKTAQKLVAQLGEAADDLHSFGRTTTHMDELEAVALETGQIVAAIGIAERLADLVGNVDIDHEDDEAPPHAVEW